MTCWNCRHDNPAAARYCGTCGAALTEAESLVPAPPPAPVRPVEDAGFLRRLAAFAVDAAILWFIGAVVLPFALGRGFDPDLLFAFGYHYGYWDPWYFVEGLFYSIPQLGLLTLVSIVYFTTFTAVRGQTPGKMAVGIRVVGEDDRPPGLGTALLRETVGRLVSTIPFYLGFLWMAWDTGKQGWHDKIAFTWVVRVR